MTGTILPQTLPFDRPLGDEQVHLRLLGTTDLHMHLWPYDYYADRASDRVGLSRTASLIKQARAEAQNCLLFDNGDFLQGNPMGDLCAKSPRDPHPMIRAMHHLGYDAVALGNHEFNYGLDFLQNTLAQAKFPIVSANVTLMDETPLVSPYVLLDRELRDGAGNAHSVRIGVIGLLPPQIMIWDRPHLEGRLQTQDIIETARHLVPQMRAEGAEIVVALCHAGIGSTNATPFMEHASAALAGIAGIDAVMAGHTHLVFPGPDHAHLPDVDANTGTLQGTPGVMAGAFGSHLGVIDLRLERRGDTWHITEHRTEARPIFHASAESDTQALVADDPAVLELSRAAHQDTLTMIRQPVGSSPVPLQSYFAQLPGCTALAVVAEAQRWFVAKALEGTALDRLPLLSAVAPFKAGGRAGPLYYTDVAAGPIAIRNLADLYLYPNDIQAVRITGAEIANWLERAAGQFNQIPEGASDASLLDPVFSSYNFDVIYGLEYEIDLSQPSRYHPLTGATIAPAASRIRNLRFNGQPLRSTDEFVLATNAYRANGGGSFPGMNGQTVVLNTTETVLDVLIRYFSAHPKLGPVKPGGWRFAPMPGTSVTFDTGPKAESFEAEIQRLGLTDLGPATGGFRRYRLALED